MSACVCVCVQIPCSAIEIEKNGNGYRLVYLVEVALTDVNNLSIISQWKPWPLLKSQRVSYNAPTREFNPQL